MTSDTQYDDMILLHFDETFDKKPLYKAWKKGQVVQVPFAQPVSAEDLDSLPHGAKARLNLSYLNENFASWLSTSMAEGAPTFPTLESTLVSALVFLFL